MTRLLGATMFSLALLGCRPQARLGDGPPAITDKTKVLAQFDPAALAEPSPTGFDPGAGESGPPKPPEPEPLPAPAVVDYGPTAEASEYPTIQIRFNRPMVPLGEKVRVDAEAAGFEITPKIAGEAYWAEPTRLVFEPETALPPAHEYTVRFQERLASVDGPPLDVSLEWRFATAPPSVSMWAHYDDQMDGGREYHWKAKVAVDVTQDVALAELRRNLTVTALDSSGAEQPIEVAIRELRRDRHGYRPHAFEITPKTRWPASAEIVLSVAEGLRGKVGPRSMAAPYTYSFSTPAGVAASGLSCSEGEYDDGCELGPILVGFSAPISRAQAKLLTISPKPKHLDTLAVDRLTDERGRERDAYDSVMLWGEFERGVEYEVSVDERLVDVHGQPLESPTTFGVKFVEPPPSLALEHAWGSFIHSRGAKLGIESRHVERLRVRVAELDAETFESVRTDEIDVWPAGVAVTHDLRIAPTQQGAWGWSAHELDLAKLTKGRPAALLVEVSAESLLPRAAGRAVPHTRLGLVQITDLGVTAVGSLPGGVVRVASLRDDSPVVGAEIELIEGVGGTRKLVGKTDADGLLRLEPDMELPDTAFVWARSGSDRVLLDARSLVATSSTDALLRIGEEVRTSLMSERPLYRPGERVRAMGWAAIATPYELSGLRRLAPKTKVSLELRDRRDEVVATRTVTAKAHGKFWATLDIPENAALGHYTLTATLLGATSTTGLRVEDYPIPEFEVAAAVDRSDLHGGESTSVRVDANYYFGGRVPIRRARHADVCSEVDFRPPGIDPLWSVAPERRWGYGGRSGTASAILALGPTAERGHLEYEITPRRESVSHPLRCTHSVAVGDATEREIGAEASVWVHPDFYLAAHGPRVLEHGQDATIEVAGFDFDGSPLAVDGVTVSLVRTWSEPEYVMEDKQRRFAGWRSRTKTLPDCKIAVPNTGPAVCKFSKLEHGSYEVRVRAKRGDYEPVIEDWLWVREPDDQPWTFVAPAQLEIAVDRPTPAVGDKVRARIQAPWQSGPAMVLLTKGGLHEVHVVELEQGSATLELSAIDAWIPAVELQVLAIEPGSAHTTARLRRASTKLTVDASSRELAVDVQIPSEAQTGEKLPIQIAVRDAAGKPARGHVSVWAVDEAVLSLAPLELPNFIAQFSVALWTSLSVFESYSALLLPYVPRPDSYVPRDYVHGWASGGGFGEGYGFGHGSGSGFGGRGSASPSVQVGNAMPAARQNFSSAPIFIGDAELDEHGRAKLEGELPDNLTTFRVTAVASAPLASPPRSGAPVEARFGTGDARVRVTRPLVVRAALPRVLRPGDQAEFGVLVDNLRGSDGTLDIDVSLHEAGGALELLGPAQAKGITLKSGEQIRVPFTIRALGVGTPQVEVRATLRPAQAEPISDAVRLPLPIEAERTLTDRVAIYGSLDDDGAAVLPFAIPTDADPRFGGLSVSLGSTLLGGLEDAVAYLVHYPYGCLEQTSSSLLPLIPLGRLAAQGYPLGIDDVDQYVDAGIARLRSMQLPGGGFSYWPGGTQPAPYASAYATWVLSKAAGAGYRVPDSMLTDAHRYLLATVDDWSTRTAPSVSEDIELALVLMTLAERGHTDPAALDRLYERRQRLPVFAQAMLLLALHGANDARTSELQREVLSLVDEREAVAKVETDSVWTWYWDSDVRSSAILLIAMLRTDPDHPLVSKLTRGLLESRRGGRWSNTQENAYALLGLADYAAIYEADQPDFDGRVWLANEMLASVHVEGRAFGLQEGFTAMDALLGKAAPAGEPLLLERAGKGRMYYRVGLEWASTAVDKPAKAEGIRIERTLRGEAGLIAEDAAVAAGDLLALDIDIEIPAALDHVALEIPLPAGLEAINLDLGKGTAAMKLSGHRGSWVTHQELRRDRAVLFADHLEPGKHRTTVALRATTPGEYVMPAAHGEMMYYPEVYGRTTARRLLVR